MIITSKYINKRKSKAIVILCLIFLMALSFLERNAWSSNEDVETARRILPGYSFIFSGQTYTIERGRNSRAFVRQHPMMFFLLKLAPYVENYQHPANHPIIIRETTDRIILELPCRFMFPPYNWTVFWGSEYEFKMEIDKKTKDIIDMARG